MQFYSHTSWTVFSSLILNSKHTPQLRNLINQQHRRCFFFVHNHNISGQIQSEGRGRGIHQELLFAERALALIVVTWINRLKMVLAYL